MGQPKNGKFAITTSEVVFIFLLGLLIGVVCMSIAGCSQEFSNASKVQSLDSGSPMVFPEKETGRGGFISQVFTGGSPGSGGHSGISDSAPIPSDRTDGGIHVEAEASLSTSQDSGSDTTETSKAEAGPKYCVDCPAVFGRPPCCSIYLRCGYITSLGNCTDGHL